MVSDSPRIPHLVRVLGMTLFMDGVPAPAPAQAPPALDEVVVTARRTEETLQQTPVAVTALTADQLEARAVKDLRDIGRFTPNAYLSNAGVKSPDSISMFIRGVGLSDQYATMDPGVGLYIDGVYYARAQGAILDLVDVQRVEVLRGPQGTLFGKNTAGGAINIVSNPPDPTGGGALSVTVGNVGQLEARGSASLPLAEEVTLRLSALGKRRDCLSHRKYDDACIGGIDRINARGALRWRASSHFTVDLIADATEARSNMLPNHAAGYDPNLSFWGTYNALVAAGQIPGGIAFTDANPGVYPGRYEGSGRAPNESPLDASGVSLNMEYRNGDKTLHSITAYRDVSSLAFENGGGGTGAPYDAASVFSHTRSHWISQELRVDGAALSGRLDYIGGLYYFGETGTTNEALPFFAPVQAGWVNFNAQELDSYAAFMHGSFRISGRLRASMGVRYTRETKDWSARYARFAAFATPQFDPNTRTLELIRGNGEGIRNELDADPASTAAVRRRKTWTLVTPKLGVDFQLTPDVLLFANVSRGSRAGGFNGRAAAAIATAPFHPEYTLSYEIGEKVELMDRRLRINTSAFYTDYKDLQQSVLVCVRLPNGECEIGETGLVFAPVVANAASARIYGGELELVAIGSKSLRVEAAVGYLRGKFASVEPFATQSTGLTTSSVIPFASKWTAAVAAQYGLDLGQGSLVPRVDYTWRSEMAFNVNPGPYGRQGSVGLVNATLSYQRSNWSTQLYARNLADKDYALWIHEFRHVVGGPGGALTKADPRELGVIVTRSF